MFGCVLRQEQLDLHAPVLRIASCRFIRSRWGLRSQNSGSSDVRDRNTPSLLQVVDDCFCAVAAQLLVVSVVARKVGKTLYLDDVGGELSGAVCQMHKPGLVGLRKQGTPCLEVSIISGLHAVIGKVGVPWARRGG